MATVLLCHVHHLVFLMCFQLGCCFVPTSACLASTAKEDTPAVPLITELRAIVFSEL